MVIERAFALLKGRFRRLKYVDIDKVDDILKIVIVACVLDNISLCNEDSFLDFMDDQDDEVNGYKSILTPNTPAVQKCTKIMEYLTQLLTVVTCVVQMKIHCNIGDNWQAQIDFCLFCASKKLKQRAEIYLHFKRLHTWIILKELLIPSC